MPNKIIKKRFQMNIFITGKPGSGKTRLIRELIEEAKRNNKKVAGIFSPEIRENNTRIGFEIIDLASGKKEIMAHVKFSPPRVSKYGVSIENIEKIVQEFEHSFNEAEYIFLDELGPMELKSKKFRALIEKIISSEKINIIILHRSLLEKFKEKGEIFNLAEGKEKIKQAILQKIIISL